MISTHGTPAQVVPNEGDIIRYRKKGVRPTRPTNFIEPWGTIKAVNRRTYRVRTISGQEARVPKRNVFMVLPREEAARRLEMMEDEEQRRREVAA